MNLHVPHNSRRRGSILILAILFMVFMAVFLATYLVLTQGEYTAVARSQAWNSSLVMAEAGVEEALALVNKNVGVLGALTNWTATAVTVDHWTPVSSNSSASVYSMTRWLGTTVGSSNLGHYTVYVTNNATGTNGVVILSVGYATWASSSASFLSDPPVRKVLVKTKRDSLLNANLAAISTVDFNGNNVTLDSFDSGDPYHSDWQTTMTYHGTNFYGLYPANPGANTSMSAPDYATEPFKRKDNAYVATDGPVISSGNANIYGYVNTAPNGNVTVGNNGTVGDVFWVPTPGIQPGHSQDDMNTIFADVVLPAAFASATTVSKRNGANALVTNGYTFNYVITNTGYFKITSQVRDPIYVRGTNIFLYLPAGLTFNGNSMNSTMYVESNSDLTIYTGADIDTSGQAGINNIAQYAPAFAIYGLPGCTDIKIGGNGTIVAYVYAPSAYLHMGGSGGTYAGVGAFFVKQIQLNGNMAFHYDEQLKLIGPARAYIPSTWQEVY
jgi:hypothetical protein